MWAASFHSSCVAYRMGASCQSGAALQPGSAIINTASINSDHPNPTLLAYATTKGAIQISRRAWRSCLRTKEFASTPWLRGPSGHPSYPAVERSSAMSALGTYRHFAARLCLSASRGKSGHEKLRLMAT